MSLRLWDNPWAETSALLVNGLRQAGAREALLNRISVGARWEGTGDHLLPAADHPPPHRKAETRDLGSDRRRACLGAERGDDDLELVADCAAVGSGGTAGGRVRVHR